MARWNRVKMRYQLHEIPIKSAITYDWSGTYGCPLNSCHSSCTFRSLNDSFQTYVCSVGGFNYFSSFTLFQFVFSVEWFNFETAFVCSPQTTFICLTRKTTKCLVIMSLRSNRRYSQPIWVREWSSFHISAIALLISHLSNSDHQAKRKNGLYSFSERKKKYHAFTPCKNGFESLCSEFMQERCAISNRLTWNPIYDMNENGASIT